MELTKRKIVIIIIAVFFTLSLSVAGYFLLNAEYTGAEYREHYTDFDDGWTLSVDGRAIDNVILPTRVVMRNPEVAVFSKTLPDTIKEDTAIITRNYHLQLNVKIDGQDVYAYPNKDWNGLGNLISDEWCVIDLKPEYAGKTIEISFTSTSNPFFRFSGYIGEFKYGEDNSLVHFVRDQGLLGVILGGTVSGIGVILFVVSIIYRAHTKQSTNTAMGVAFCCFGIWMANRAKMGLFPQHSTFAYWISLMCLMFVAPFFFLYSYYRNNSFKKFALYAFRLCLVANLFTVVSCFFINYSVEYITPFAYLLSGTAMFLTSYSLFLGGWGKESIHKSATDRLLDRTEFFSTLIFLVLGIIELVFYSKQLWTEWSSIFMFGITLYAIIYFGFVLWRTFLVVQDRTNVTRQLHDSQLELMMGQIQPHFMFNTLSSIRTLIKVDPDVAYDMVYNFSNYLRANVDNMMNLDGIPFSSEVNHIQSYVEIEKVRLGDRLTVTYDIQDDDFTVPPLSIQPIIENAIKHGIRKKVGGGEVLLKSYSTPSFHVVEINDDGIGFNDESAARVFGLYANDVPEVDGGPSQMNVDLMKDVMEQMTLLDKDGNPIKIGLPEIKPEDNNDSKDLDAKHHKSSGMTNVLLRLRDMAGASIKITSKENEGTNVKVYFPR